MTFLEVASWPQISTKRGPEKVGVCVCTFFFSNFVSHGVFFGLMLWGDVGGRTLVFSAREKFEGV